MDASEACSNGQLVIDSFIMTICPLMNQVSCSFFEKHQITQVTQPLYSSDLAPYDFWLFPKPKSPLKVKRFQTIVKIHKSMMGQLMATGRTVRGPKVPTLKRTDALLSYLVSSSINVSTFHMAWLDTFWTDLVYIHFILKASLYGSRPQNIFCNYHTMLIRVNFLVSGRICVGFSNMLCKNRRYNNEKPLYSDFSEKGISGTF